MGGRRSGRRLALLAILALTVQALAASPTASASGDALLATFASE